MSEIQESFRVVAEAYPEIGKKIKLFWGNQEFTDLLQNLLYDTRGHTRDGFPLAVSMALFTLQHWHDQTFPQFCHQSDRQWAIHSRQTSFA